MRIRTIHQQELGDLRHSAVVSSEQWPAYVRCRSSTSLTGTVDETFKGQVRDAAHVTCRAYVSLGSPAARWSAVRPLSFSWSTMLQGKSTHLGIVLECKSARPRRIQRSLHVHAQGPTDERRLLRNHGHALPAAKVIVGVGAEACSTGELACGVARIKHDLQACNQVVSKSERA